MSGHNTVWSIRAIVVRPVNGSEGVQHIVEILRRELEAAMALTGRTTIGQVDRTVLWPEKP